MEKKALLKSALAWVNKKPVATLRSVAEGYEDPITFLNKRTNEEIQPDVSFVTPSGIKYYTDIAVKTDEPQKLVTKWKLLSMLASMKRGKLYLLAPKGHKMFTEKLVKKYNIEAEVQSI